MNIFGYFPLFQSFTFCKSTSDIKKIQNKMAATQVALLLLSSILNVSYLLSCKVRRMNSVQEKVNFFFFFSINDVSTFLQHPVDKIRINDGCVVKERRKKKAKIK